MTHPIQYIAHALSRQIVVPVLFLGLIAFGCSTSKSTRSHSSGLRVGSTNQSSFGITFPTVTHDWRRVLFGEHVFNDKPVLLVAVGSHNDGDTVGVRVRSVSMNGFQAMLEEETSADGEREHGAEHLEYIAFSEGMIRDRNGRIIGEAHALSWYQSRRESWKEMPLRHQYNKPIAFAQMTTRRGTDPSHIRFLKVDSGNINFQIEEWLYDNGSHKEEDVSIVVLESGTHPLDGNHTMEVGELTVGGAWQVASLITDFVEEPVVIAHRQTNNDPHPMVVRQSRENIRQSRENIGFQEVQIRLQKEQGLRSVEVGNEQVGYLAVGVSAGNVSQTEPGGEVSEVVDEGGEEPGAQIDTAEQEERPEVAEGTEQLDPEEEPEQSDSGDVGTDSVVIENRRPVARFVLTPTSGVAPLTVDLDASNSEDLDGQIVAYRWDFGDGTTGSGVKVSHTYPQGDYTVRLTVMDDDGARRTTNRSVSVTSPVDIKPPSTPLGLRIVSATTSQISLSWGAANDNVGVSGYRVYRDGVLRTTITGLVYDDHNLPSGVTHIYQVSAVDAAGNESDRALIEAATVRENQRPVARFVMTPTSGVAPLAVDLDASNSEDLDGQIVAYRWDFGDGTKGSGVKVSHTYPQGSYTIRLTVTDDDGARRTTNRTVSVEAPVITEQPSESNEDVYNDKCPAKTWNGRPYPPSTVIKRIRWHDGTNGTNNTLYQDAGGSDIWAVTWMADEQYPNNDGSLLLAWGDGVGFGPSSTNFSQQYSPERTGYGFSRVVSNSSDPRIAMATATNFWGGQDPDHTANIGAEDEGKVAGTIAVDGVLYGWINMQFLEGGGEWPDVHHGLVWSEAKDGNPAGAEWTLEPKPLRFEKGYKKFKPATFVNYGMDYNEGMDERLGHQHVYFSGRRQGVGGKFFMGRVDRNHIRDKSMYSYFAGRTSSGKAVWTQNVADATAYFRDCSIDGDGGWSPDVVINYNTALKRYILSTGRSQGGELAIYEAPNPWGPWSTVAYESNWMGANDAGTPLLFSFVNKWTSSDGLTNWMIFSLHAGSKKTRFHDKFNMMKATFVLY